MILVTKQLKSSKKLWSVWTIIITKKKTFFPRYSLAMLSFLDCFEKVKLGNTGLENSHGVSQPNGLWGGGI